MVEVEARLSFSMEDSDLSETFPTPIDATGGSDINI